MASRTPENDGDGAVDAADAFPRDFSAKADADGDGEGQSLLNPRTLVAVTEH